MVLTLLGLFILIALTASFSGAAEDKYFSGDNITVNLLLDANKEAPAELQLMIYNPENKLIVNGTKEFDLEEGENQINYTVPFITDMDGLHYIRYDIFADLDGGQTLVQSSTQYFDGEINDPPVIDLISPEMNSIYSPEDEILFSANVSDPEGQKTNISWSTNVSGIIGNGTSFYSNLDSVGTHKITITAEDEMGAESNQSILIEIAERNDQNAISTGKGSSGTGSTPAITNPSENDGNEAIPSGSDEQIDVPNEDVGSDETQNIPENEDERGFLPGFEAIVLILGLLFATGVKRRGI
ncbi:hypothetical protein MPF_2101 [Methanohalophilus portucalensis FDF-1]|nr:hypothetical protein MPF_2101 [Methanohalophilus portucalensis FDF-1]